MTRFPRSAMTANTRDMDAARDGSNYLEGVRRAREVCERVFYWLALCDEGPETTLPCPEQGADSAQLSELAELAEEARVAARMLGGLKDEDESGAGKEGAHE